MKYQIHLMIMSICILATSCSSSKLMTNDQSDIQFNTSTVYTQDERKFYVRETEVEYVKNCIAANPNLDCTEVAENTTSSSLINDRAITIEANPLKELFKNPMNCRVEYEIGINRSGNVIIMRLVHREGDITEDLAFRTGKNLMNMKYDPDPNAQCITMGKFSIVVETK